MCRHRRAAVNDCIKGREFDLERETRERERERERRKEGVEERDREVFGQEGDERVMRWVDCTMGSLVGVPAMKCREERGRHRAREGREERWTSSWKPCA